LITALRAPRGAKAQLALSCARQTPGLIVCPRLGLRGGADGGGTGSVIG
jgi:hypothetical protein